MIHSPIIPSPPVPKSVSPKKCSDVPSSIPSIPQIDLGSYPIRHNLYTLPASYPFVRTLAEGIFRHYAPSTLPSGISSRSSPLLPNVVDLSQILVFLPYQRAISYFYHCLESLGRQANLSLLLLPKVFALGSLWSQLSVVPPLLRLGLLFRCIQRFHPNLSPHLPTTFLHNLASTLNDVLDQLYLEEISLSQAAELIQNHAAEDLQSTFIATLLTAWPEIISACGEEEFYKRHSQQLTHAIASFQQNPPQHPVIIAGSTGTSAAVARLMNAVIQLPHGHVIFHGLDPNCDLISPIYTHHHPHYQLYRLITKLNLKPQAIKPWPWLQGLPNAVALARQKWFLATYNGLENLQAPRQKTPDGHHVEPKPITSPSPSTKRDARFNRHSLTTHLSNQSATPSNIALISKEIFPSAYEDLSYLVCATPEEEAQVIAMIIREFLEKSPHKGPSTPTSSPSILVITADAALGQRVKLALREWAIDPHNSAASFLAQTNELAQLWRMMVQACREQNFKMVNLFAIAKHPLVHCKVLSRKLQQHLIRHVELNLRQQDPPLKTFDDLIHFGQSRGPAYLPAALLHLKKTLENFKGTVDLLPLAHHCATYQRCIEDLCGSSIWQSVPGQALGDFLKDLTLASTAFPLCDGLQSMAWVETLMKTIPSTPLTQPQHPHIQIVGSMEARLMDADLVILSGMNEGSWPPNTSDDPWLTPSLRQLLGLPESDRRIGLSAHDFLQAFSSPRVIITRSSTQDGMPTLTSRFLLRLEAVSPQPLPCQGLWLAWAQATPSSTCCQPSSPEPKPPSHLRTHQASVTQIQTWEDNPYVFYARHLMKLAPLPLLDTAPSLATWGNWVHRILEKALDLYTPTGLPSSDQCTLYIQEGLNDLAKLWDRFPVELTFFQQRFISLMSWFFATQETIHTQTYVTPHVYLREFHGSVTLKTSLGNKFVLKARADRIDLESKGYGTFIDYKTGAIPPQTPLCQLRLEVAMASRKGFPGVSKVQGAAFWRLKAPKHLGIIPLDLPQPTSIDETWRAFENLLEDFLVKGEPYRCYSHPSLKPYAHLSRWAEWRQTALCETYPNNEV